MAIGRRGQHRFSAIVWPGFVDVMTALVLVLFFVLSIFMIVQFVLRELSSPSPALDRIYDGVFDPLHRRLCLLWQRATGEPAESDATKLTVFTLIGQVVYFRIGREAVLRLGETGR